MLVFGREKQFQQRFDSYPQHVCSTRHHNRRRRAPSDPTAHSRSGEPTPELTVNPFELFERDLLGRQLCRLDIDQNRSAEPEMEVGKTFEGVWGPVDCL